MDQMTDATLPIPAAPGVLTAGCDGYRAGTTGAVVGRRDGCLEFAPDAPDHVARWARPRATLLVPASFVATVR